MKKNILIDSTVGVVPVSLIESGLGVKVNIMKIDLEEFVQWQKKYYNEGTKIFRSNFHKKMLELFVSFKILNLNKNDVYLDAAGGQFSYASKIDCKKKIIQDLFIAEKLKNEHGKEVEYIECSSASMPFEKESIDKISCHHSLEHFQKDDDIGFIKEIQRILSPNGKCVILPIFIGNKALLVTDKVGFNRWDEEGFWLLDSTASLPGGEGSGNFSRIYDTSSLKNRIINHIDISKFKYTIHSLVIDKVEIPNKHLFISKGQSKMNFHYKVLEIERIK